MQPKIIKKRTLASQAGASQHKWITEKDVPVSRHEIDTVHLKRGRSRALAIGLNDVAVNAPRVARVGEIDRNSAEDNGDQRVRACSSFFSPLLFAGFHVPEIKSVIPARTVFDIFGLERFPVPHVEIMRDHP